MGPAEEKELVERALAGDERAREEIVRGLYPRLLASAIRLSRRRDLAEDLAQETVYRSLRALESFDGRSALFTWTYRILLNLFLNHARREAREVGPPMDYETTGREVADAGHGSSGPEQEAIGREGLRRLWEEIQALGESLRVTVLLVVFEGLNYEEAGHALGCSEGTVAWRMFRVRQILRERLRDDLDRADGEARDGAGGVKTRSAAG
jgi:RNA polymerase sigma-70 factor (ECF subfamily)